MARVDKKGLEQSNMKADENENYIRHSMELFAYLPLNMRLCQPNEIEERCLDYFQKCIEDNMKPNVAGFALAIGCTRVTLMNYISGVTAIPSENQAVLIHFYSVLNSLMEDYIMNGKMHPLSGVFLSKNNFGYKDSSEIVQVENKVENVNPERLIEESKMLLQEPDELKPLSANSIPTASELIAETKKGDKQCNS